MATARINIEGFVSKNPETRPAGQSGQHTITTVTVPVEQGRMKDGQWVADTDKNGQKIVHWWEAEFWNDYGQQVGQEIQKGYLVRIEGEPRPRAYVKNDGTAGIADTIANPTVAIVVRRPSRNAQGGSPAPGSGEWHNPSPAGSGAATGDPGFGGFDDEQPF